MMMDPNIDGFTPPNFDMADRGAMLVWQERQRRQRSLRMLMMFLFMLMLMDGEDSQNRRSRSIQSLRKRQIGLQFDALPPSVYFSRIEEDRLITTAVKENMQSRHYELLKKNGGRDVEDEIHSIIQQKLKDEIEKGTLMMDNPDGGDGKKKREKSKIIKEDLNDSDERESTRTWFHYPRNATGYYRGIWVTVPVDNRTSNELDDAELISRLHRESDKFSSAIGETDYSIESPRNVTADEVYPWSDSVLRRRGFDAAVLLLPPGVQLQFNTTSNGNYTVGHVGSTGKDSMQGLRQQASVKRSDDSNQHGLTLSKVAGRAAFQLYSRPIPAMDAISLVDGFVKLYDGMTNSFVTRRTDVLMRVRGVLIHGVGKLSLVTSHSGGVAKGRRRSVFGIRQVKDEDEKAETEMHQNRPESEHIELENETEEARKRRRLLSAVDEIAGRDTYSGDESSKWSNRLNSLAAQVRLDVMDLYWSQYMSEILTEEELPGYEMDGWNRLQSIDEDLMGSDDGDLAYSRRLLRSVSDEDEASTIHLPRDLLNGTTKTSDSVIVPSTNFSDTSAKMALNKSAVSLLLDSVNSTTAYLPQSSVATRHVHPFPYVLDDADDSVKKHSSPPGRLPARESVLEANLGDCEFEINVDAEPIKWSYGEWRSAIEQRMRIGDIFNPFYSVGAQSGAGSQYLLVMKSQLNFLEEMKKPEEALIMSLSGDMQSENCDIRMFVNVTASRISWEHTTAKAINYSFYMMLTCLTQIIVLLRQLLHTQSNSVATNVSLMCIGWQAVLDAIVCISHIFLCLIMSPLVTAFASVAFFKLLIFCVIEMKYLAIIIQARNNANNTGLSQEEMRRQITLLHLKFYGALMLSIVLIWYLGSNRSLCVLLLYSFWVPQIILNIMTESRKPMHPYYIYGMSITRSVAPIYVFAIRDNFLKEVNPDFPTEVQPVQMLVLWIAIQTAILRAQSKYGTRFMIPKRFLPPKYNYSRPIPASLLPASNSSAASPDIVELGETSPTRAGANGTTRNRRGGSNREETPCMSEDTIETNTLDCIICHNEIDTNDPQGYMLTPCDHIFHRQCLEQWMDVKMECPVCRNSLPAT